jgi:hypothetical protein
VTKTKKRLSQRLKNFTAKKQIRCGELWGSAVLVWGESYNDGVAIQQISSQD